MVPENVLPVCVIDQCALFIMAEVRPAPIMEPLESDAVPSHAPVIVADAVELGAVDIDDAALPPHAAIATVPARRIAVPRRMMSLLALTSLITGMRTCSDW